MSVRLAIIAFLLLAPAALAAAPLRFTTSHAAPHSTADGTGSEDLVLKEALRRLGYQARILHLPSKRSIVNVNIGVDDGHFSRIPGLQASYRNLVLVPEPICTFEFAVFSKRELAIDGWDSLKPYRTGVIGGWMILERNLAHLPKLTVVANKESLFSMLAKDRLDAAVFELSEGVALLKQAGITNVRPTGTLVKRDLYVYLNKRHQALAGRLATALKDMKRDGTFQRIVARAK